MWLHSPRRSRGKTLSRACSRASVLFIADGTTLTSPDHPILVVDLGISGKSPFRCVAPELWGVENNLNISNMDCPTADPRTR
jgi:hypothetical protein